MRALETPIPPALDISIAFRSSGTTLAVRGELDLATAPDLRTVLLAVIEAGYPRPALDLSRCGFMDCSGLHVLIEATDRLSGRGEILALAFTPRMIWRILRITEVDQLLVFDDSVAGEVDELTARSLEDDVLIEEVARSSGGSARRGAMDTALHLVLVLALAKVVGADGASITLMRQRELRTVAASDDVTEQLDAEQYRLASGPCVEAARDGQQVFAASLEDEVRWPDFVAKASEQGIASMLSTPLVLDGASIGALNLNVRGLGAFSTNALETAAVIAGEASKYLAATADDLADPFHERISRALRERDDSAKAVGILMARERVGEDAAFDRLRKLANSRDKPVSEVAASLLASTGHPPRRSR